MAQRVEEDRHFAFEQAVDEQQAGDRVDDVVIADIDPSRPGDPAEPRIEDEQSDETEPEDRHGIAEQAEDADDAIGPAALP